MHRIVHVTTEIVILIVFTDLYACVYVKDVCMYFYVYAHKGL